MKPAACPTCGGTVTRYPEGRVTTTVVSRYHLRTEEPRVILLPRTFDACDRCEWAAVA